MKYFNRHKPEKTQLKSLARFAEASNGLVMVY